MGVLLTCTSCMPSTMEVRRCQISWNLGYRWLVISQYMGAGNWTWDLGITISALNH